VGSSSAGGGITNTGTISAAGGAGIDLVSVATFFGSIVNGSTGKIIAAHGGIDVTSGTVFGAGSTARGRTNAGIISAGHTGIFVSAATFLGSIVNSAGGKIVSRSSAGIHLTHVTVFNGITNSGTISAAHSGIVLDQVATFGGDIRNRGAISA